MYITNIKTSLITIKTQKEKLNAEAESAMYEHAAPGETKKRDLHQDDLNGFSAIYG